jgi:hypothetical protein
LIHAARVLLLTLLAGYFVFNKLFAQIGFSHLYVGEFVLAVLLIVSVLHYREVWLEPLRNSWLSRILFAFLVYGSARALLDALSILSKDDHVQAIWALRDGVCVGYAAFAFVGIPVLTSATASSVRRTASLLEWIALPALLWTLLTITNCWPTTQECVVASRKVDMLSLSVTVSAWVLGVLAFSNIREKGTTSRGHTVVLTSAGALLCAAVALRIPIRAAWIAAVVSVITMLIVTFPRWVNRYVMTCVVVVVIAAWTIGLPYIQNNDTPLAERIRVTLFGGNPYYLKTQEGKNAIAHIEWREKFWQRCILKTSEDAPLFGLGFGKNLTDLMRDTPDWYRYVESQQLNPPNRSPHNATVTVYTRLGVIGVVLWLMIVIATFVKGVRFCRSGNAAPDYFAGLTVFGTWIIYIAYMSVGVVLENPFGGIWFWILTGAIHTLPRQSRPPVGSEKP